MRTASGAVLFLASLIAACSGEADPDAPLPTWEERDVLWVESQDLYEWMRAGHANEVVFVDNRNAFSFQQQRIAGARLIPTGEMARSVGSLPLNKWIVLYCT